MWSVADVPADVDGAATTTTKWETTANWDRHIRRVLNADGTYTTGIGSGEAMYDQPISDDYYGDPIHDTWCHECNQYDRHDEFARCGECGLILCPTCTLKHERRHYLEAVEEVSKWWEYDVIARGA